MIRAAEIREWRAPDTGRRLYDGRSTGHPRRSWSRRSSRLQRARFCRL
jgi:hypothetical protein